MRLFLGASRSLSLRPGLERNLERDDDVGLQFRRRIYLILGEG